MLSRSPVPALSDSPLVNARRYESCGRNYGHQVRSDWDAFTPLMMLLGAMGIGWLKIFLVRVAAGHNRSR